ncbi:MAG: flagellar biosynthesis protein FlhF [Thermosulfidibacteraceae bacterium]|jgi:flagellar biosynthesis protein FlhF
MKLKKFVGRDMASILLKVKETLGEDAVIISSRKVGDNIEVLAAKEEEVVSKVSTTRGRLDLYDSLSRETIDRKISFDISKKEENADFGKVIFEIESLKELILRKSRIDEEMEKLRKEMDEIKKLVEKTASTLVMIPGLKEDNVELYNRLKEMEVDETFIRRIYERITVEEILSPDAVAFEMISKAIRCGDIELAKGVPIVFVGPTGVGKTTTIAKLSALIKLYNGMDVAIVSIDVFRVGAMEQMKIYADIVDIPLYVAETPGEFKMLVEALKDKIIFVDTAGASPKDDARIGELKSFMTVIDSYKLIVLIPVYLRLKEAMRIIERFSIKRPDGIILTKVDEADTYGLFVNLSIYLDIPLLFMTTGQRIPEDIEKIDPKRIAQIILKGEIR